MKGTLKKRMDKDSWFVVFQSDGYNESDMAYELLKSQEIDIDMYDVYKDGDEVTFEVINKKWAKITPFLYPFENTSSQTFIMKDKDGIFYEMPTGESQTEISDDQIRNVVNKSNIKEDMYRTYFIMGAQWYREQLKQIK